jgi:hypothetical protein
VSGLETAIRNALDRSNRADRDTRVRIYQSARQALDAGLRKQGVSDRLIIMQQHELLEDKIHQIEMEEVRRLAEAPPPPEIELDTELPYIPASEPVAPLVAAPAQHPASELGPDVTLGGETRTVASSTPQAGHQVAPVTPEASPVAPVVAPEATSLPGTSVASEGDLGRIAVERDERMEAGPPVKTPKPGKSGKSQAAPSGTTLDVPPERAAKPRKRRGFLSHLLTWLITLAIVGGACWWFYQSGMVQSFIDEAMKVADQSLNRQQTGREAGAFDPRNGFSDDWVEIFVPSDVARLKPSGQAKVEAVAGAEGQAVRILSMTSGEGGDVAIEVPAEVLRDIAGKSSTVALTLQSAQDRSVQLSVRCEFGSLGNCSRHRFTATQEKLEALFRVTFERSLAPNAPGRLVINAGLDGPDLPVLLYSVRILPGQ